MFVVLREGLLEPKHRERMGDAIWLYLWLHTQVRLAGDGAGATPPDRLYRHEAARRALGYTDVRQIKRHFRRLEEGGYVTAVRRRYGLAVTVTRYLLPGGRRVVARPRGDTSVPPHGGRGDTSVPSRESRSDTSVPPEVTHVSLHTTNRVTSHQMSPFNSRNRDSVGPPSEDSTPAAPSTAAAPDASATRRARTTPARAPSRSAEVIDLLRARGLPDVLSARDHAAVKRSGLAAGQIVEAFEAAYGGRWGDPWLRDNLCVRLVIERWAGYQAHRTGPATRNPGRSRATAPGAAVTGAGEDPFAAFEKYG